MAWEQPLFNLSFTTAKDLSSYQFQIVNLTTADQITVLTSAKSGAIGILQDKPTSGMQGSVMVIGVSKVKAGGAINSGQLVGAEATSARVIAVTTATMGSTVAIGRAFGASAQADDIIPVLINFAPQALITS